MPPDPLHTAQASQTDSGTPTLPTQPFRIGMGYDLHRLESFPADGTPPAKGQPVRPLILGGVKIPHDLGVVAHSDGDAVYHAITDALLGALAQQDIGQLFPDTSLPNKGQDSAVFLRYAATLVGKLGYSIANLDATIILERPKISPHKLAIRTNIARELSLDLSQVNIKGKTHESLDSLGAGRGVEVHVVVLLLKK
ncbi:MAG: 2-C-methyl-D-erythritol 2,4-cyclodiphosphate synthase [Phycisphaerales bacterium]